MNVCFVTPSTEVCLKKVMLVCISWVLVQQGWCTLMHLLLLPVELMSIEDRRSGNLEMM